MEQLLRRVHGVAEATSTYSMMLLGYPGVKADVMIRRYVGRALGRTPATPAESVAAVTGAAAALGTKVMDLEHTIWEIERKRRR